MGDLPAWARWIVVAVFGLSPMFIYLIASTVGRFLRRRRWPPPAGGGSIVGDRPPADAKDETAGHRVGHDSQ
jgi:hypothetical protein